MFNVELVEPETQAFSSEKAAEELASQSEILPID